jgi:predicted permease
VATTPPPVSSFPLVQQMGGDGEFGGQIVVLSTALAFPTIFLWVFTLSSLGLF